MPGAESGRNVPGIGASFPTAWRDLIAALYLRPLAYLGQLVLVGHILRVEGRQRTRGRLAIGLLRDGAGRIIGKARRAR